jgi:hypothetical protein
VSSIKEKGKAESESSKVATGIEGRWGPGNGFRRGARVFGAAGGHRRHSGAYAVGTGLYLDASDVRGAWILRIRPEFVGVI